MELKDRKYIKNTSLLPKHDNDPNNTDLNLFQKIDRWGGLANKGFGTNYGALGSGITSGIQFYGALDNAFSYNRSVDDLQADAGLSQLSVGGISYRYQNDVNRAKEMERVGNENKANTLKTMGAGAATGAAIGSLLPGAGTLIGGAVGAIGGLIGGLFGSSKRKREAERRIRIANQTVYNTNDFYRSGALSTAMQQDYAKQYGDTRQLSLYGAADGKDEGVDPITNETYDDFVVETADGKKVDKQNSWVEKGEWIWNPITEALNYVDHGPNDGARANLKPEDVVFTKKHNIAKNVPKFAAEGRLGELASILAIAMKDKNNDNMKLYKAKCGKLPKHAGGVSVLPNLIANGLTTLGGLYQYLDAKNQDVKKPNSYVANPYETRALNDLYSLRVNPYPIIPELYNEYAKAMTSVNRSGGLSGGQRALARLSAMNSLQRNTAQMLQNAQERNNQYRAAAAQAAMAAGSESAKRRAAANQYDLEYYSRAHAAKKQGEQQAMYNMLNGIQSFLANNQNMSMFNNIYGLYASEQERKNAEKDPNKNTIPVYTNPDNAAYINGEMTRQQEELAWEDSMKAHAPKVLSGTSLDHAKTEYEKSLYNNREIEPVNIPDTLNAYINKLSPSQKKLFYKKNPGLMSRKETVIKTMQPNPNRYSNPSVTVPIPPVMPELNLFPKQDTSNGFSEEFKRYMNTKRSKDFAKALAYRRYGGDIYDAQKHLNDIYSYWKNNN